jgi:pyruvate/2-oxoglutarate dehydrogenase complex dihydrolipoamide acyltransferase (E2) component
MAERVFRLPDLGEGLEEAEISSWLVAEGDEVALNQPLVEVETAKAVVEIPSPLAGRVVSLHAAEGSTLAVGDPLVTVSMVGEEVAAVGPSLPASVAATPAVRATAKRLGVDLSGISGTGPEGRVTRADVENAAAAGGSPTVPEDVEVVRISAVRRAIAETLAKVVREVPQVTTWRTVDCSALEALRRGLGVSPLPVVVRALAEVCVEHPWLSGSYLAERGEIHLHRRMHIGIATDTERGLVVPVVRDVGTMGIGEVAARSAPRGHRAGGAARTRGHGGRDDHGHEHGSYGSGGDPDPEPAAGRDPRARRDRAAGARRRRRGRRTSSVHHEPDVRPSAPRRRDGGTGVRGPRPDPRGPPAAGRPSALSGRLG